jgi:hypothetical protein
MFGDRAKKSATCLNPVVQLLVFELPLTNFHHALFKAALPCHELQIDEQEFREKTSREKEYYLEHADTTQYL